MLTRRIIEQATMVVSTKKINVKLCPRGAQTYALPHFFTVTLKLEGDLGILKICLHTENEVASLTHSKLRACNELKTRGQSHMAKAALNDPA